VSNGSRERSILVVPAKPYPSEHAMLDAVFARELPARGWRVRFVMQGSARSRATGRWHESPVEVFPGSRGTGPIAALRRSRGWMQLLAALPRIARIERPGVIVVRNSVTAALVAWAMRRATGARFVYQLSFPTLESTIDAARDRRMRAAVVRARAARVGLSLRRFLFRRADLVLAISDQMRDRMIADGCRPDRVLAFPLGAESVTADPDGAARLRERLTPGAKAVVLYFGIVSPTRRLDFLIDVAATLAALRDGVHWLLVGPSFEGEAERLQRLAVERARGVGFDVLPAVPRAEMPLLIQAADVTVAPIPVTPLFEVSSPTKVVESLAAGRPVVATPIPDQRHVVERSGGGVIVRYDAQAFAGAIDKLLGDPSRATGMGESGRAFVEHERSYARLTDALECELGRIGG
jgi:glycosyltransferase involved in cell wall biosynthesis